MNILLYQNKRDDALKMYLEYYGYTVIDLDYSRINQFNTIASSISFDIVIIEELPETDCFKHIAWLGPKNVDVPIVLITSNQSDSLAITALKLDIDSIWYRPISPAVLFTKLAKLADPSYSRPTPVGYMTIYNELVYNTTAQTIEKDKKAIVQLSGAEHRIFRYLLKHLNKTVSRKDVIKAYNPDASAEGSRSFDTCLSYLRSKLKAIPILKLTKNSRKELTLYLDFPVY